MNTNSTSFLMRGGCFVKEKRKRGEDDTECEEDEDLESDEMAWKIRKPDTSMSPRGTLIVDDALTEDEKANLMIDELFKRDISPQHEHYSRESSPAVSIATVKESSPAPQTVSSKLPLSSSLLGGAVKSTNVPLPKFSSKQMLHKAYENQAETWNLADSVHGMVRHGDLQGIQQLSQKHPNALYSRDGCGANILHQSLLINRAKQRQIVCWLLDNYSDLLEQTYESDVFEGEVALHFPIVHRDIPLARLLLTRYPEALRCRAKGTFFQDPAEGCFFGEYPIMFAASTNQAALVTTFLEVGERCINLSKADHLQLRDFQENTIFHLCVYHNIPDMYDFIEGLCDRICPEFITKGMHTLVNAKGYTPFTLAAKLGREEIFNHLLKRCSITEWRYGPVNCRKVALIELDRSRTADTHKKGVLQILEEEGHSHLLMHPLIQQLQQEKWDTFAGRYFMNRVLIVAAFIEVFFLANVMRGNSSGEMSLPSIWAVLLSIAAGFCVKRLIDFLLSESPPTARPDKLPVFAVSCGLSVLVLAHSIPLVVSVAEIVIVCGAFWKAIREVREVRHSTVEEYFSGKGAQLMENILSLCYIICIITATVARFLSYGPLEDVTLSFASLSLWAYVLWLLLGFRKTGPFVIMIWKMLLSDLIRFLIIFAAFLFGFAQTFFILFDESGLDRFLYRLHICFVALLGQAELSHDTGNRFPLLSTVLLLIYVLLVSILLLNLLVAMMSSTYTEIQEEAEEVWRLQWTRLIFSIESEMSPYKQKENTYWTELEDSTGKMERYLVASNKKVGEDDIRAYFNPKANKKERVRPPSLYVEDSELHDVLDDPNTDAAYTDKLLLQYEIAYPTLSREAIASAGRIFSEGLTPPDLVQLLVAVSFAANGGNLMDLLSKYYFGASPPAVAKARNARFLAALLFTQRIKTAEIRSRFQSFSLNPTRDYDGKWPDSISREPSISK